MGLFGTTSETLVESNNLAELWDLVLEERIKIDIDYICNLVVPMTDSCSCSSVSWKSYMLLGKIYLGVANFLPSKLMYVDISDHLRIINFDHSLRHICNYKKKKKSCKHHRGPFAVHWMMLCSYSRTCAMQFIFPNLQYKTVSSKKLFFLCFSFVIKNILLLFSSLPEHMHFLHVCSSYICIYFIIHVVNNFVLQIWVLLLVQ